jgi:hypothetical protein
MIKSPAIVVVRAVVDSPLGVSLMHPSLQPCMPLHAIWIAACRSTIGGTAVDKEAGGTSQNCLPSHAEWDEISGAWIENDALQG